MRRSTLTIGILLLVAMVATAQTANASSALSVGGGISLTESAAGASMGSRFDACRKIACKSEDSGRFGFTYRPIAAWFSSTGMMPFLVMSKAPGSPVYRAAADFNNIERIGKVELTPDHGMTVWEATNVALKGYQVEIPYLSPGGYGFEWKVTSRDKHNRLMIIFIPISWKSSRTNSVVQQVMVQSAPESCWNFDDEQWISLLSPAFQPATALPDPGYLAKRAAQRQVLSQMTPQTVQPVAQPIPVVQPEPESVVQPQPRPRLVEQPKHVVKQEEKRMRDDGFVPATAPKRIYNLKGDYQLVLTGAINRSFTVNLTGELKQGSPVEFELNGRTVVSASVTSVESGKIFAEVDEVGSKGVQPGDRIIFDMEEDR